MGYRDDKAPRRLELVVQDQDGNKWGILYANKKDFSTGSVGFYASGKLSNPNNPAARYQAGLTFTLIGSK